MASTSSSSSSSGIQFKIAFEGDFRLFKTPGLFETASEVYVTAIEIIGTTSKISAQSSGPEASSLIAGPLKWCVPDGFAFVAIPLTKLVDQITLAPEVAKTMKFNANVIESIMLPTKRSIVGNRLVAKPERWTKPHDIPIDIVDRPVFEDGASYLIKIQNLGKPHLQATFQKSVPLISAPKEEKKSSAKVPDIDRVTTPFPTDVAVLFRMDASIKSSKTVDPELQALSADELLKRYNAMNTKAKNSLEHSFKAFKMGESMNQMLMEQVDIEENLMQLEMALKEKGVHRNHLEDAYLE